MSRGQPSYRRQRYSRIAADGHPPRRPSDVLTAVPTDARRTSRYWRVRCCARSGLGVEPTWTRHRWRSTDGARWRRDGRARDDDGAPLCHLRGRTVPQKSTAVGYSIGAFRCAPQRPELQGCVFAYPIRGLCKQGVRGSSPLASTQVRGPSRPAGRASFAPVPPTSPGFHAGMYISAVSAHTGVS